MSSPSLRNHLWREHLAEYIEQAAEQKWEVLYVELVHTASNNGHTIEEIRAHFITGGDIKKLPSHKVDSNKPSDPDGCASTPAFSIKEFHKYLASFIVTDDEVSLAVISSYGTHPSSFQSINVVECLEFRGLLLLLRETLKDMDIPHRTHMCDLIINTWYDCFVDLQKQAGVHDMLR